MKWKKTQFGEAKNATKATNKDSFT